MTKAKKKIGRRPQGEGDAAEVRVRILDAAFATFMAKGYAAASTLEIATRARVSKRELYALVGKKEEMLVACITNRARRFQVPELPEPRDRDGLQQLLASFGAVLLREISDPAVIGMFRLAIAESHNAPEVARTLQSIGRAAAQGALRDVMAGAVKSGLLAGAPDELVGQFNGLLWQDLMISLLLGVAERPDADEVAAQAREAAAMFLRLQRPS